MTVLETIQKGADFLSKKGVDSPRLQAELLLAHTLKLPRMKLYLNFERSLTTPETEAMRDFFKRRALREPLQHIIGTTSFCGLEMVVNRHVLVPRPETELLAEMGWQFLKKAQGKPPRALDFGTGSGCIAIALAVNCPEARIIALDTSTDALAVARGNAQVNGVLDRIEFIHGNGLKNAPGSFDLIISNPPYISSDEIASLQPEVRDYDPRCALDGGADGLDFYRMLAAEAASLLSPAGRMMLEFGDEQAGEIRRILTKQNWIVETVREDYTSRPRIVVAARA